METAARHDIDFKGAGPSCGEGPLAAAGRRSGEGRLRAPGEEPAAPGAPEQGWGSDAPVPPEDRGPGELRGAGARSPLFWKAVLASMALMWGFSFFVVKDALDSISPSFLLMCRFGSSALIMLALFRRRVLAHLNARYLFAGLTMGVLMWGAYTLQTVGLGYTTAGKNAFLTGTYCVLVPFISYLASGEHLTRYNVGAAFMCLAGIGLVALDSFSMSFGDLLTLGGAVFFALQIAAAAKFGRDMDVNVLTFWMFLGVGALSAALSLATEPLPAPGDFTPQIVGVLAFLTLGCTCVGLFMQNIGLAHVPSSTGSLLLSLESPFGVLFSVLLGGEQLTLRLVAGFALIFCSIVLSETHFGFLRRALRRR